MGHRRPGSREAFAFQRASDARDMIMQTALREERACQQGDRNDPER
jgi:hypothetical protein